MAKWYLTDEKIKGKRIMVVDDEPDLTLCYRLSLEYHGFEVETFNDPRKALSNFKPDYYDLVVLDIKMPLMDGFELYSEIKKIVRLKFAFLQQVNYIIRSLERKDIMH
jgi:DNA-binding response OmpR family regulator